jgi:uncharacterized protein
VQSNPGEQFSDGLSMNGDKIGTQERAVQTTGRGRVLARPFLIAFGGLCVGLGVIGIVVPGLPTVPFLLLALWAFSKSSQRFHDWLYNHPKLGPPLRDWREHGVIPTRAKWCAMTVMAISLAWISFGIAEDWVLPTAVAACLIPVAIFIVTRPGVAKA